MARFMILFTAFLLVAGSVVKAEDPLDTTTTEATTTTTTTTDTTTTSTTTTATTTTTEETTTTEPPTTTTETTTTTTTTETPTTTEVTTSTTAPPTTTTAPPTPDIKYNVTDDKNVTCIIVAGEIYFNVNYTLLDNTTAVKSVFVPSLGVTVDGSCDTENQYISFSWDKNNSVQMNFKLADKDAWMFTNLTAMLLMDDDSFPNATDYGSKILELTVDYNFSPGEVSVNHSFICRSSITTSNVTATIGNDTYGSPVTSALKNIQMQAFNKIKDQKNFAESVHCTADNTSDVVPIAVGCALAGLVVIVLIAYLVGRRKRSGAYQSV